MYVTGNLRQNARMLRLTCFEQFLDTRQTLGNIISTCNAAGMEGTHGQLSTRFTDGLCSDSADCLTYINVLASCQVAAIALAANAEFSLTGQYTADLNLFTQLADAFCHRLGNIFIDMIENFTIFIQNILSQVTANDTVMQCFNDGFLFLAFGNCLNLNTGNFVVADTHFLNSTVSQNSVDNVFGHGVAGMCQHFACTVNDISCYLFIVEVMHHSFLQHIMCKGVADVDADSFNILTIHIFIRVEVNLFNLSIIEFSEKLFSDVGICFCNQVAFCVKYTGGQGAAHNLFADFVLACTKNSLAQTATFLNQVHTYNIAIILTYNYVLSNVNQTTSQVTGVSST